MFNDLDDTLTAILAAAPAALPELQGADASFAIPDRNFTVDRSTLNLFLFEIKENRILRDPVPIIELDTTGAYVRKTPPLRVDLLYMVTAWSDPTQPAPVRARVEHRLLGEALLWFSSFPVINRPFLRGSLDTPPAPLPPRLPPPTLVAQMDGEKNAGEFWAALGIPPRPSFSLLATIAMELAIPIRVGPPVAVKELRFPGEDIYEIAGTIRDANTAAPVPGARVTLVQLGRETLANASGQYTFSRLSAGNLTLRAAAAGFTTRDKAVAVPNTVLDEYDVSL